MQLFSYHTEHGIKPAFVQTRGRKYLTVIMLHPEPKAHKVPLSEERYMKPLEAKNPGRVFRRNVTATTSKAVKRALRGIK